MGCENMYSTEKLVCGFVGCERDEEGVEDCWEEGWGMEGCMSGWGIVGWVIPG